MANRKERIDLDKHSWHPSVLPGQIVVVSTSDQNGEPNIAPKSWVTMAAFKGPLIAFGCNVEHTTYKNIVKTQNYVINIPGEALAERIWALPHSFGKERIRLSGFTMAPADEISAPLVSDCSAHLECVLEKVVHFGPEVMVFGLIAAISIDSALQQGDIARRYLGLRPIFFLEDKTYGVIDGARQVEKEVPVAQDFFLIEVDHTAALSSEAESAYWRDLANKGTLLLAGNLTSTVSTHDAIESASYIISADSYKKAEAITARHPGVLAGATYRIKHWHRQF